MGTDIDKQIAGSFLQSASTISTSRPGARSPRPISSRAPKDVMNREGLAGPPGPGRDARPALGWAVDTPVNW
jgi:hypothetical protein